MSSGEVLISELFVSRRKERKDLAARWEITVIVGNRSEILFPGSSCPLVESVRKKKSPYYFRRNNNINRDQIQNQYIYTINYKIYLQLHKIYFEYN